MTTPSSSDTFDVWISTSVPAGWEGVYDRIEVWRSVLGADGPYEELSAESWQAAMLPADAGASAPISGRFVPINGKTLELLVEDHGFVVTFTGVDPIPFNSAASQISTACMPLLSAYVDAKGNLVLHTSAYGPIAHVEVVGGDAAPLLGLVVGEGAVGKAPRTPLVAGTTEYVFRDYYGKLTYFYKTRLVNSMTGAASEFTAPQPASKTGVGVLPSNLVRGFVRLARRDGKPDEKQQVLVYAPVLGYQIDGYTISGGHEVFLTDADGYLEVTLVRGMEIDVSVGGTSMSRHVTVPTDPAVTLFDLLSPAYGTDDAFTVKKQDLPFAERRTL